MQPREYAPAPFRRHPEYETRLATIRTMRAAGASYATIGRALGLSKARTMQLASSVPEPRIVHARHAQCVEAGAAVELYRREKARRLRAGKPVLASRTSDSALTLDRTDP